MTAKVKGAGRGPRMPSSGYRQPPQVRAATVRTRAERGQFCRAVGPGEECPDVTLRPWPTPMNGWRRAGDFHWNKPPGHHQPLRFAQISSSTDITTMTTTATTAKTVSVRVVDDDVHAQDRRQRRDRQGDRGDDRQPLGGDGHLGVGPGLVELDDALQVVLLAVRHRGQPPELVDAVLHQRRPVGAEHRERRASGRRPRGSARPWSARPAVRAGPGTSRPGTSRDRRARPAVTCCSSATPPWSGR